MLKSIKFSALALAGMLGASSAHAALIQNGSFEAEPSGNSLAFKHGGNSSIVSKDYATIAAGDKWGVWGSIPGWTSLYGDKIELQMNGLVEDTARPFVKHVETAFGSQYVELDTHFYTRNANGGAELGPASNVGIYQTLENLVVGATYELTFWYRARTSNVDDNTMNVFWSKDSQKANYNSNIAMTVDLNTDLSNHNAWQKYSINLKATDSKMAVGFGGGGNYAWSVNGFPLTSTNGSQYGALLDNVGLSQVSAPATGLLMLSAAFGFALRRRKQA